MQVCFIGHRKIQKKEEVVFLLKETVKNLIDKGATTFLFGSMSEFNDLAWEVVTECKEKYPFIQRVYVRSAFPYIDERYKEYLLESYEETYFSSKLENAGKRSYVKRNYEMIDASTYCVFYYDENYVPLLRRQQKRNDLLPPKQKSGTKIAFQYAIKKGKTIINLYQ